jgi:hypothetical protein
MMEIASGLTTVCFLPPALTQISRVASRADGETIAIYASAKHAVVQVKRFLQAPAERLGLARAGHEMISTHAGKPVSTFPDHALEG